MDEYYVDIDGGIGGPFTLGCLTELYRAGRINDRTIYSTTSNAERLPVSLLKLSGQPTSVIVKSVSPGRKRASFGIGRKIAIGLSLIFSGLSIVANIVSSWETLMREMEFGREFSEQQTLLQESARMGLARLRAHAPPGEVYREFNGAVFLNRMDNINVEVTACIVSCYERCAVYFFLSLYFLPSWIVSKGHNFKAIFLLNLLTGWTFFGWVASLVWAVYKPRPTNIT